MKKLLVLIMAALMILAMAVAGCGGDDKADKGSTAHKEKLVIGTDADINNLNLQKQQDAANNVILKVLKVRSVSAPVWLPTGSS